MSGFEIRVGGGRPTGEMVAQLACCVLVSTASSSTTGLLLNLVGGQQTGEMGFATVTDWKFFSGERNPLDSNVLGAVASFLEPFGGHLSPKVDKIFKK